MLDNFPAVSMRARRAMPSDAAAIATIARALQWPGDKPPASGGFLININSEQEYREFIREGCPIVVVEDSLHGMWGFLLGFEASYYHQLAPDWATNLEWRDGSRQQLGDFILVDQIAVLRTRGRSGVGAAMLRELMRIRPDRPLIAEVLQAPHENRASLRFFKSHGFYKEAWRVADSLVWSLLFRPVE
ncbi:MAG: hypothetical protein MJE77_47525 [Proteobacteria bacterium]|nr:hypothetical protein [Pseudomonadota bacterium]